MARVVQVALVSLVAAALVLSGCATKGPVFVEEGNVYNKTTALLVLKQADASAISAKPTSDGQKSRHAALAALRRNGATASAVADLLTRTFPSDTSGVPVYVERATYDGKPAVVVVEATGPDSGWLNSKRLWVIGETGDILLAGSR